MDLAFLAAFVAACGAARLDRTYLPPGSSPSTHIRPGIFNSIRGPSGLNDVIPGLQTPFERTSDNIPSQGNQAPSGSYENEHQGVVVDAAAPGTRASDQPSGLGGPRVNYGSTDSKVGDAAFRGTKNQAAHTTDGNGKFGAFQSQTHFGSYQPQGPVNFEPDLSGFYQHSGPKPTGSHLGTQLHKDHAANTLTYHNNIGLDKFDYGYETENGIKAVGKGISDSGVNTEGGYSYKGDDGKVYSIHYTADKAGFRPTGDHLPTPHPIPAEIMESLQQNAKDEANGIYDDGSYDAQKYNAEDDYAQSIANVNYNDRQSNKFGERPGSDAGASTFINQDKQAFVRPNIQGQFSSYDFSNSKDSSRQPNDSNFGTGVSGFDNTKQSNRFGEQLGHNTGAGLIKQGQQGFGKPQEQFNSYDFSKDTSSTQPVASKLGTGVSGFDNTKQSNTFGVRPGFDASISGSFYNHDKQSFVRPNLQGPLSSYDFSKDSSSTQPDSSKLGIDVNPFNNTSNKGNSLTENGQNNQANNRFGAQFQYLPPLANVHGSKLSNVVNNLNNAHNRLGQNIQDQGSFGNPSTTLIKPSSFGTSITDQGSSNNQLTPSSQNSNSFDTINSAQNGAYFQTGIQSSISSFGGNAYNSTVDYGNGPLSLPTPTLNIGVTSVEENLNNNLQNQRPSFQTGLQSSSDSKNKNTNPNFGNTFSSSIGSSPALPTKKPELTLTTPLENQKQQTNSASSEIGSSFIDTPLQNPGFNNFGNTQSFLSNNKKPSDGQFSTFPGQLQGPDDSYIYNKPIKQFNTPSTQPDSNRTPGVLTGQFNSVTQPSGSLFPEGSIFSTQYQGLAGSTKYPQPPTMAPIAPTLSSSKDEETFQTNGITQASISSFPSITPTSSSQTNSGEVYDYTKPAQGFSGSSQEETSHETKTQNKESSLSSHKEDSIKPQISVQSNNQQTGQSSSFGQQTTPSRFGDQADSTFGRKPINQPQFGAQGISSFEQKPTFGVQTSSYFGQKPAQQLFGSQSSFPFGQKTTPSRFGQTDTSLNQQTTLTPFGAQTSSSFGKKPTQSTLGPQTSTSFNEQIKPSQFGVQPSLPFGQKTNQPLTGFSFGQQTAQSPFGAQISSTFGQRPTQAQLGGQTSFLSQSTPYRFGPQTSISFNKPTQSSFGIQSSPLFGTPPTRFGDQILRQKPSQSQLAGPTSFSFGSQTKPSRFGDQISSTYFGQKPTQQQSSGQTSFSFGSQSTPPRFGSQTSTSFNQQVPSSPFGIPSRFGAQASSTFGQKPQLGGQTSFSFGSLPSRSGSQINTSFGQQNAPSTLGIQSSSSSGQQTTPSPFGVQTDSIFGQKIIPSQFNLQTGSPSGQQTTSRFGVQTISSTGQQSTPTPPNVQTSFTFGQKITPPQFDDSSSKQQSTPQLGNKQQENENFAAPEKPSESQESNEQSETQSDSKPSTSLPFSSSSQNSQESVETNSGKEIYQYNKPTTNFETDEGNNAQSNSSPEQSQIISQLDQQSSGLNKEDGVTFSQQFADKQFGNNQPIEPLQFGTKPYNQLGLQTEMTSSENDATISQQSQGGTKFDKQPITQSGDESFSTPSINEGASQPNQQVVISQRFPEQQVTSSPFSSQKTTQSVPSVSSQEQSFDNKESTSQLSSTGPGNTQISSQNSQSTFNLQEQDQSQNSQPGEVYQYDKPSTSLSETSQEDSDQFGQNTQQGQSNEQPGQNKLDVTKPITSHLSQGNENLGNVQLPTQSPDVSQSQTDNKLQSTSTQGNLPISKPFNSGSQLSFHSACCRVFRTQTDQGSFPRKNPSDTHLNANFGSFGFNKNEGQGSNGSGPKDNKFSNQGPGTTGIQEFGVQKGSSSFSGKGEEFGGPREPPKFDKTGYHY